MIIFVTGNENKVKEVEELTGIKLDHRTLDLPEIQGVNSKDIIESKVRGAYEILRNPVIVEDTSLHFNSLNGLPGALIKWFLKHLGVEGCYKILECYEDKSAIAICSVGYTNNGDEIKVFTGKVKGDIVPPKGTGFGWDVIFIPEGYDKRFSEMSIEEKNQISHRAMAFKKLQNYLKEIS